VGTGELPEIVLPSGDTGSPSYCLGASLATAEVEIALTSLASEMPGLALAVSPGDLRWRDSQVHSPSALPVTW
jgi:cytochrome P450